MGTKPRRYFKLWHKWSWLAYNFKVNRSLTFPGLLAYLCRIEDIIVSSKPDIMIGASDPLYVVISFIFAKYYGIPVHIDLNDDYEHFNSARIPRLLDLYRTAVKNTDGLSLVSSALDNKAKDEYGREGGSIVIENGTNTDVFKLGSKKQARTKLNLPLQGRIFGYTGSLTKSRGIEEIIDAFFNVHEIYRDSYLILAGRRQPGVRVPQHEHLLYLDWLESEQIPLIIQSLDVAIVGGRSESYIPYCYPQKAVEYLACGTPFIAPAVGSFGDKMSIYPECLYDPEDVSSITRAMIKMLKDPVIPDLQFATWMDQVKRLDRYLDKILDAQNSTISSVA